MELLEERNKRIAQGRYRVSVSLAVAAITLPFAEMIVGYGEKGKLWEYSVETNDQLCNLVSEVFKPHNLVKRLVFSAQRILIMQTAFLHFQKTTKVISMQGYAHARELLMIQNAVTWHSKELPVKWPHEIHHSTHGGKSR
jgi:poly(A) polymerase